jgi:hypothetical protein
MESDGVILRIVIVRAGIFIPHPHVVNQFVVVPDFVWTSFPPPLWGGAGEEVRGV